jgi:hypothetical protein
MNELVLEDGIARPNWAGVAGVGREVRIEGRKAGRRGSCLMIQTGKRMVCVYREVLQGAN